MALTLELPEPAAFDINEDKAQVVDSLRGSPEIEALTGELDVYDLTSIVTFGHGAAEKISMASDSVLRSMSLAQLDDSGDMMRALAEIMGRFNVSELKDKDSFFGKLFGNARKQLDGIISKYETMGTQIDRIYVQLRKYEEEIKRSNAQLEDMFQANVVTFHELEKYIVAGDQGCREIQAYIDDRERALKETGDQSIGFELTTLRQALTMLEQRVADLRVAETVALQAIPMIRMTQFNNMTIVRKIESAFIVTLPVFKQALAQAILLKRQKIQSEALHALDARTEEILRLNAKNASEQAKIAARVSQSTAVKAESLEDTWRTIMSGISETQAITKENDLRRAEECAKLEKIRKDYEARAARNA